MMPSVRACRHLNQEARVVLTSLRGGPPHVARGDLAQDLLDLRSRLCYELSSHKNSNSNNGSNNESEVVVPVGKNDYEEPSAVVTASDDKKIVTTPTDTDTPAELSNINTNSSSNPYARPFLQVIMDPRASGPHTLVTLRALYRLLQQNTIQEFNVDNTELCVSVLACKFEQTDAGADEAVEMAIADVLCILAQANTLPPPTFLDAFNTVFVTRNTFVHSPALCYHFEDVLLSMVETVFSNDSTSNSKQAQLLVLEFLVNQLLHTPLVGTGEGSSALDESVRDAQMAHDDTRILCLRLVRKAVQTGSFDDNIIVNNNDDENENDNNTIQSRSLLNIVQDDLCLSLLMTGQAIWVYHDTTTNISPGYVSLEVLSEICSTLSILWNKLRIYLIAQFETIFTGFYTRALVLLRKRKQPINSIAFNANFVFDNEIEIILESLVDILCLHDHTQSIATGDGGCLETLFSYYDCHLKRSDVATGLFLELSRCCGGTVNADGEAVIHTPSTTFSRTTSISTTDDLNSFDGGDNNANNNNVNNTRPVHVEHMYRQVPAHLKELCAQALMFGMQCLFRDDHPSPETLVERSKRKRSILLRQINDSDNNDLNNQDDNDNVTIAPHYLRDLKSKKRLMCKAARIFNQKASRGIEFLIDSGLVPDPITPTSMATFLRNGIVVGLDKKAVGAYLGEAGKAPIAGKSPPVWERDWFHKDVLQIYCTLFRFEGQSLLDSLRMFLATFRLPGEAQQIDRILQAFSDTCSKVCEESIHGRLKLFSNDPKRASDAAYLLSFSIIMLNTDRHNANIREDRKMSVEDFVKNNTDYGRDITDKGKEFPREYLEGIYESINDEEIRTEGEGADGAMTVERWKDVLRGSTEEDDEPTPSHSDAEDLTELVLEHVWKPIISSIGALWHVTNTNHQYIETPMSPSENPQGNLLGVQGARLGMDMALEMLDGVCQLGRIDIFRKIFNCICDYSGLLGEYNQAPSDRAWTFTNSLESQAAVVVAVQTAMEHGEYLEEECWKRVWSILFELRDLKLLSRKKDASQVSLLRESGPDLLNEYARKNWNLCLIKGDMNYLTRVNQEKKAKGAGLLSAFGRALFGPSEDELNRSDEMEENLYEVSLHRKEKEVIWDEGADSDAETSDDDEDATEVNISKESESAAGLTAGARFEEILVQENMNKGVELDLPVTGLERMDETRRNKNSPRARVRDRLRKACDLAALVSESRFMDEGSIESMLRALVSLVGSNSGSMPISVDFSTPKKFERSTSDVSISTASLNGIPWFVPISPASEALAEVLICELAIKNRDRLSTLWKEVLQDHYLSRLTSILVSPEEPHSSKIPVDPGLEKRITGLLRLSECAVHRPELGDEILSSWRYLLPVSDEQHGSSPLRMLDRHISEGTWRIVSKVDSLANLGEDGWEGLVSLLSWCAKRGGSLKPLSPDGPTGLSEDDPALQCYRSLHTLLNTEILGGKVPCTIVLTLRCLIAAGCRRKYSQLSIASLDLLDIMHEKTLRSAEARQKASPDPQMMEAFWKTCWRKIVEAIAEAAELSPHTSIRQHALSLLTDLFLQKQGGFIPAEQLCSALSEVCVPLAGRRIIRLQIRDPSVETTDDLMMEFELCIGLIFKPLRHHLKNLVDERTNLPSIWKSVLSVIEDLLSGKTQGKPEEPADLIPANLKETMNSLANEHLLNAIKVLLTTGLLSAEETSSSPGDLTSMTWEAVGRMGVDVQSWKSLLLANLQENNSDHAAAVPQEEIVKEDMSPQEEPAGDQQLQ